MTKPSRSETLADSRQVEVVLRLVLDGQGRLVYGQVVDDRGTPRRHFGKWPLMTLAVRSWLSSQKRTGGVGSPGQGRS